MANMASNLQVTTHSYFVSDYMLVFCLSRTNQIQFDLSRVQNTTGVDFTVKCLLTSPSQRVKLVCIKIVTQGIKYTRIKLYTGVV